MSNIDNQLKYFKYKKKYLDLKDQFTSSKSRRGKNLKRTRRIISNLIGGGNCSDDLEGYPKNLNLNITIRNKDNIDITYDVISGKRSDINGCSLFRDGKVIIDDKKDNYDEIMNENFWKIYEETFFKAPKGTTEEKMKKEIEDIINKEIIDSLQNKGKVPKKSEISSVWITPNDYQKKAADKKETSEPSEDFSLPNGVKSPFSAKTLSVVDNAWRIMNEMESKNSLPIKETREIDDDDGVVTKRLDFYETTDEERYMSELLAIDYIKKKNEKNAKYIENEIKKKMVDKMNLMDGQFNKSSALLIDKFNRLFPKYFKDQKFVQDFVKEVKEIYTMDNGINCLDTKIGNNIEKLKTKIQEIQIEINQKKNQKDTKETEKKATEEGVRQNNDDLEAGKKKMWKNRQLIKKLDAKKQELNNKIQELDTEISNISTEIDKKEREKSTKEGEITDQPLMVRYKTLRKNINVSVRAVYWYLFRKYIDVNRLVTIPYGWTYTSAFKRERFHKNCYNLFYNLIYNTPEIPDSVTNDESGDFGMSICSSHDNGNGIEYQIWATGFDCLDADHNRVLDIVKDKPQEWQDGLAERTYGRFIEKGWEPIRGINYGSSIPPITIRPTDLSDHSKEACDTPPQSVV